MTYPGHDSNAAERHATVDAERHLATLEQSEAEFRALADHLPLMVWVHDAEGNQQFVNQTFCDYFGVDREDMKAQQWQVLTHPDDGTAYVDAFVDAVANRHRFNHEVRAQRADGTWRWLESWGTPRFDEDGTYLGHIGASADVTVRRRAQKRLATSAAFTERVLDNLMTFAGVLTLDGTVISANRAPLDRAGITLDDVVDRPFWECPWWSYDAEVVSRLREALAAARAGERVRYDVDVQTAGGAMLPIDFQVAPLYDDDGEITHLIVSGVDLSERRAAELAVERTLGAERAARRRAETLEAIAAALAAAPTVADAARAVVDTLGHDDHETLAIVVERDGRLLPVTMAGESAPLQLGQDSVPVDDRGPVASLFRSGQLLVAQDGDTFDERFPDHRHVREAMGFESAMAVPLRGSNGEMLGLLLATSTTPDQYRTGRRTLLLAVAAQTGGAFERARLQEEAEHQREIEARARARAEVIAEVITEVERADHVGHQVVRLAATLVPRVADFVTIEDPLLADPVLALSHVDPAQIATLAALRRRHRLGRDHGDSVVHVMAGETHRRAGLTADTRAEIAADSDAAALLERLGCHSYLAIPIALGPGRQGVMLCGLADPDRRPYDVADEAFVSEIAQRTAAILTATALREQEHASSLRLQKALLPDRLRELPAIDIAARYEAGADVLQVGGDWYDTFVWGDRHYGLVVGDVVGHGIEAAAAMGRLRAASATLIAAGAPNPAEMLSSIERCARGPDGIDFLTAAALVVDTDSGQLCYASAGHPPALVLRPGQEPTLLDDALTAPICALSIDTRPYATMQLEPDDLVVVFSDGLVERRDRTVEDGLAELSLVVRTVEDRDVEHLNAALIEHMVHDSVDDVVLVAMRYAPSGEQFRSRFPARRSELGPLRRKLSSWLDRNDVGPDLQQRVMLGVGEATANSAEHAYRGVDPGEVGVRARWEDDALVVVVHDDGVWQEAQSSSVNRGRGLTVMGRVADNLTRLTGPTGTTITMRFVTSSPPSR